MDCNSWNSNLQAYGIRIGSTHTAAQFWHHPWYAINPQVLQMLREGVAKKTYSTNIGCEYIGTQHESFQHELRGTITNQTISLHLSQSQSSIVGTTFCRLPREPRFGTPCARVHLVSNHMLTKLITNKFEIVFWIPLTFDNRWGQNKCMHLWFLR